MKAAANKSSILPPNLAKPFCRIYSIASVLIITVLIYFVINSALKHGFLLSFAEHVKDDKDATRYILSQLKSLPEILPSLCVLEKLEYKQSGFQITGYCLEKDSARVLQQSYKGHVVLKELSDGRINYCVAV